jgi:hypothetical protein
MPSLEGRAHGGIARPRCNERRLNDGTPSFASWGEVCWSIDRCSSVFYG